jgi:hypothetical protein
MKYKTMYVHGCKGNFTCIRPRRLMYSVYWLSLACVKSCEVKTNIEAMLEPKNGVNANLWEMCFKHLLNLTVYANLNPHSSRSVFLGKTMLYLFCFVHLYFWLLSFLCRLKISHMMRLQIGAFLLELTLQLYSKLRKHLPLVLLFPFWCIHQLRESNNNNSELISFLSGL